VFRLCFSPLCFRVCWLRCVSVSSADSRPELCGTDTHCLRCVGCIGTFTLRFFESDLRLPFTPLWLPVRSFNWYQSRFGSFPCLNRFCDPLWRPLSMFPRRHLLTSMGRITDIGKLALEPISRVEELEFGKLLRMRPILSLLFARVKMTRTNTMRTTKLLTFCLRVCVALSSIEWRILFLPIRFGPHSRTFTRVQIK